MKSSPELMRKYAALLEERESVDNPPKEMLAAFKELGLDEHQWEVFSLTWNFRQREVDSLNQMIDEVRLGDDM